ncbi:MAG: 8-amino-7-oxononanoate synthase [Hyphomicrobium sp.]|nr:8-amino-7-oxononanoate synthase [Hyphomicrobium sp.]
MPGAHERALDALLKRGRLRTLEARRGLDFASNDYLGLADSSALRDAVLAAIGRGVPIGSGGSRLLRGNHSEHEALEAEAARFFRAETALFFGGGFVANTAIFSTLPARGDLIVYDALIHASALEGMRLSKATRVAARHNDAQAFADAIAAWRTSGGTGQVWIAVESLYSMDGDRAPLDPLIEIADQNDAVLVIDEAHATGVSGDGGLGLGAHLEGRENVVSLHTCGKALGVMGALVLAPRAMRDFLVNRARSFIYATAPSPLMAASVRAALQIVECEPERRVQLQERIAFAGRTLLAATRHTPSGSQIQPIIVGSDTRAVALADALKAQGFDIRAIRPPTVPEGTARLRLTITLNTSEADLKALITALAEAEAEFAA